MPVRLGKLINKTLTRTQKSSSAAGRKKPKTPATVDGEYRKWKVQYGPANRISCFDIFVASLGKGFVFTFSIITSACEKRNTYSLYERNNYKLPATTCSWHTSEELLLPLLLSLLLLLPFGMISIFSLSSSHDDAVTIVVELMTTFGCVLGLSDSILSSSSKNGVFCLVWRFPSS